MLDDVGVRVRGEQRAAGADEAREHRALVAVLRDRGDAAQQQRVVHEQQVGLERDRLVDGVDHGVDGQVDARQLGRRVPAISPGASHDSAPVRGQSSWMAAAASARVVGTVSV